MKLLVLALALAAGLAHGETFKYWVEPCTKTEAECEPGDVQLAEWALADWARASDGVLVFEKSGISKARLRIFWAHSGSQGLYGETRSITVDDKPGAELDIRSDLHALGHTIAGAGSKDGLLRDTIVYLTCLHEIGHALGLPHSQNFKDIMYSFEYGGNILEYFERYRSRLKTRETILDRSGISAADKKRLLERYHK